MIARARRLLLIPAVVLVLLGAPALALDGAPAPAPETTEVVLALPDNAVAGDHAVARTPADLVGVTWDGDRDAEFTVEVRRQGSEAWEPAATLGGDDLAPDDGSPDAQAALVARDGANASEPVWVKDAVDVRVTVASGTVDNVKVEAITADKGTAPSGSAGAVGVSLPDGPDRRDFAVVLLLVGLGLGAVAMGWSPWRARRQLAFAAVIGLLVLTACVPPDPPPPPPPPPGPTSPNDLVASQPAITMRTSWAPDLAWKPSPDCAPGPLYATKVDFVVVHHTVNSNSYSPTDSRAMVRAIWQYHVNTLGYCDIAYNFLVDKYGQIFEGRKGGIDKAVIAAHTGGFNTSSSGMAFIGDFTSVQPTAEAYNSMVNLIAWKLSVHKIDPAAGFSATSGGGGSRWPAGTVVTFPNRIVGHRDLWPTACPGDVFYPRLAELRTAVQPKVGWSPSPTTTTTATTSVP